MITRPPSNDRFDELVAQVELQGGDGTTELCRPLHVTMPGRRIAPSEEVVEKAGDDGTARRMAVAQSTTTCSCGNPTKLTIGYDDGDGTKGLYKACAVCDAVHLQPRFNQ